MVVQLRRGQLDWFRRKARATDKEILACLVGTVVSSSHVRVEYFAYPDLETQTTSEVDPAEDSWQEIKKEAEDRGLDIIGQIHSHPNWWPVKSPADHDIHLHNSWRIIGVCAVMKPKTAVYFWVPESSLPCKIKYF